MRSFGHCVGIAAPQIGEPRASRVVDCTGHPKAPDAHGLLVLVDPVIVARPRASEVGREGCLSDPGADRQRAPRDLGDRRRPRASSVEAHGFEARALQHEVDHLDGLLFLDRVESLEADVFQRRRR